MKSSIAFVLAIVMAGCGRNKPASPPTPPAEASAAQTSSAQAALDKFDSRSVVPLTPMMAAHQKQMMREHLSAVQEIAAGMAIDDFSAIEKASARIGYSESMAMMCRHMGMGAPGFTDLALKFHHTADTIGEAARAKDRKAVAEALATTTALCVACHAAFRQQVLDDAAWAKVTGQAAPRPGEGSGSEGR